MAWPCWAASWTRQYLRRELQTECNECSVCCLGQTFAETVSLMQSQTMLHNQAATSSTAAFVHRRTVRHHRDYNSIVLLQESRAVAEVAVPSLERQPLVRQTAQAEHEQGWDQPADALGDRVKNRIQRWQVSQPGLVMQAPLPQVTSTHAD